MKKSKNNDDIVLEYIPCPKCDGVGSVQSDDGSRLLTCRKCNGMGKIVNNHYSNKKIT